MSYNIWSFSLSLSLVKMVRKEKLVIALACLLLITSNIMSANATAGAHPNIVEHVVNPQAGKVITSTCS